MSYKGRYQPSYPRKYKGNPSNIIYRSLWERKFMVYCDLNENILEWGSEEIIIPYKSPLDKKLIALLRLYLMASLILFHIKKEALYKILKNLKSQKVIFFY